MSTITSDHSCIESSRDGNDWVLGDIPDFPYRRVRFKATDRHTGERSSILTAAEYYIRDLEDVIMAMPQITYRFEYCTEAGMGMSTPDRDAAIQWLSKINLRRARILVKRGLL